MHFGMFAAWDKDSVLSMLGRQFVGDSVSDRKLQFKCVVSRVRSANLGSQNLIKIRRLGDYVRQIGRLRSMEAIIGELAQRLCAHKPAKENGANHFDVQRRNN